MADSTGALQPDLETLREAIELLATPRGPLNEASADTLGMMAMASQYLKARSIEVNQALSKSHELNSAERSAAARGAKEIFETLCEIQASVSQDLFNPMLREEIGFSADESADLLKGLRSASDCSNMLASALARDDLGPDRIAKLRETPEWRRAVKGSSSKAMDAQSYFAPLLHCIAREAAPSLKAELTAKMELYIQSGWAERDCLMDSPEGQTPAARAIRDLRDALNARPDSKGRSFNTITARFNELFLNVAVKRVAGLDGEETSMATLVGESTPALSGAATAASGHIDAVIRDARDSKVLHAAVVTTDVSTMIESDQLFRHHAALEAGMRSGAIPGAESAKMSFYVPSVFYDATPETGRDIGTQFIGAMKDSLTDEERGRLNLLPFLSVISRVDRNHPHFRVDALADYELRMIGATSARWNTNMSRVRAIESPEARQDEFVRSVVEEIAGSIDVFSKKVIDGTKLRSASSNETLLSSFCSTLEGVNHHGARRPDALAPISQKIQELRVFKSQISSDSGTKRRLETEILKYSGAGGIAAWAGEAVRSEREDQLLAQDQSSRTRVDQASSHAMLTRFVADRAHEPAARPTIASLRGDLARDAKALYGFTEQQADEMRELVETSAYSPAERAANARFLSAAERGKLSEAQAALSEGAHLFALDSRGRDCITLAERGRHGQTAAWLREQVNTQTLSNELALAGSVRAESDLAARRSAGQSTRV